MLCAAASLHLAILALLLSFQQPQPPPLEAIAPHAAGVCLAKVIDVKEIDHRPVDGPLVVVVKLQVLRSSGAISDTIGITKEHGWVRPELQSKLGQGPVKPDSLKNGQRYWLAFAYDHEREKYRQGIVNFWPEDDAGVTKLMEEAIREDRYRWHPQFDPKTGLISGYDIDSKQPKIWQVRVEKEGRILWQKSIPGVKIKDDPNSCVMGEEIASHFTSKKAASGTILRTTSMVALAKGNEFDLQQPGTYCVETAFDAETGRRLAVRIVVRTFGDDEPILCADYETKSGKIEREERYDRLSTGGLKVGAKTERWERKVIRTFDIATGKVVSESVYRRAENRPNDPDWVKIDP